MTSFVTRNTCSSIDMVLLWQEGSPDFSPQHYIKPVMVAHTRLPELGKWRQVDQEFKIKLSYMVNLRPDRAVRDPILYACAHVRIKVTESFSQDTDRVKIREKTPCLP